MKKYQITLLLIVLMVNYSYGQYGAVSYPHTNSFLTGAKTALINSPGFIMASVYPYASGTGPDFLIEKTDINGTFAGPGSFSMEYIIDTPPSCNTGGPVSYNHNCIGVDIIETSVGTLKYAIAGAYNDGVFFATLDASGTIINQRYWPFAGSFYTTKPEIVESAANPGNYYICGSTVDGSYYIKVNSSGAQLWAETHNGGQAFLLPRDLIESGNDLIVVGRAEVVSILAAEGFFLSLNANTGAFNNLNFYSDGTGGDEYFNCIENAASPTGGTGFIVGGWAHSNNYPVNNTWMLKLDPSGNVIWSTLLNHYTDIVDVFERYNNVGTPHYEYFGLSQGTDNAGNYVDNVFKLDDVGTPYSATLNWFQYYLTGAVSPDYTKPQLDFVGTGTAAGDGLVAFTTDVPGNQHVMVKAWYNGVEGCETTWLIKAIPGPGISANLTITLPTITPCLTQITGASSSQQFNIYCTWGTAPGGSNLRMSQLTGLEKTNKDAQELISVYPNPSNGLFTIEAFDGSGPVEVKLTNSIGQLIKTIEVPAQSGNQKISVDFKELNVTEGLYFMNATNHNQSITKKIMYSK